MSCDKNKGACQQNYEPQTCKSGIDYLIVIVLYILLVIILSACLNH